MVRQSWGGGVLTTWGGEYTPNQQVSYKRCNVHPQIKCILCTAYRGGHILLVVAPPSQGLVIYIPF